MGSSQVAVTCYILFTVALPIDISKWKHKRTENFFKKLSWPVNLCRTHLKKTTFPSFLSFLLFLVFTQNCSEWYSQLFENSINCSGLKMNVLTVLVQNFHNTFQKICFFPRNFQTIFLDDFLISNFSFMFTWHLLVVDICTFPFFRNSWL